MEDKSVVLSISEFTEMVNYIKQLEKANKALNKVIAKYNKYAKEQNASK